MPPPLSALTVNWKGAGRTKSKAYKEWLKAVEAFRTPFETLSGDVRVSYTFCRTSKRRMDVANREKGTSDLLVHWKVIEDDCQIVDMRLRWAGPGDDVLPGYVRVELEEINPA